mmetsp:Transcript_100313/g.279241  ORF Transcript_100313/g.279241 Transcript_100313/m.279241 type:complete len:221 (-) Transcript_100313:3564-4226(-)
MRRSQYSRSAGVSGRSSKARVSCRVTTVGSGCHSGSAPSVQCSSASGSRRARSGRPSCSHSRKRSPRNSKTSGVKRGPTGCRSGWRGSSANSCQSMSVPLWRSSSITYLPMPRTWAVFRQRATSPILMAPALCPAARSAAAASSPASAPVAAAASGAGSAAPRHAGRPPTGRRRTDSSWRPAPSARRSRRLCGHPGPPGPRCRWHVAQRGPGSCRVAGCA